VIELGCVTSTSFFTPFLTTRRRTAKAFCSSSSAMMRVRRLKIARHALIHHWDTVGYAY
jgi:hypothetical protein